ncbi:MAG: glycoside hydrolase family 20 zincin-like fold domain-containing protein [Candidatus Nanoarchaeia archaeon]
MKKRGISQVISVILIIFLTIIAASLIFLAINQLLKKSTDGLFDGPQPKLWIDTSEGYTSYDPERQVACIQIKRGNDKAEIEQIQVIFIIQGQSYQYHVPPPDKPSNIPGANQAQTYCFNLSKLGLDNPQPDKVKIAPIYKDGKIGAIAHEIDMPIKNLINIPSLRLIETTYTGEFYPYGVIHPMTIIPTPKEIERVSQKKVILNNSWQISTNTNNEYDNFTAHYLKDKIEEEGINLGVGDIDNENNKIIISTPDIASLPIIEQGYNQGYYLLIHPNKIYILANSTTGRFYGMISLTWLLNQEDEHIALPNVKITDWPDLKIRGSLSSNAPWQNDEDYTEEQWIEHLTKYKYNMILGASATRDIRSEGWRATTSYINAQLERKDFLDKRHFFNTIQISPKDMKDYNANYYSGVYAYNLSMKFNSSDYAESHSQEIVFENSGFETDSDNDEIPDNWHSWPKDNSNWTRDCQESHTGCSMKLTLKQDLNVDEGESSSVLVTGEDGNDKWQLKPNKVYQVTFWGKRTGGEDSVKDPQITAIIDNGRYKYTRSKHISETDNIWRQYSFLFPTFNTTTEFYLYTRAQNANKLTYWVDDFEIKDVTEKMYNIIETQDTRLHVYNKDRTIEYKEGEDYELQETGEIIKESLTNPSQGKKTNIKRLTTGSINPEQEIKVDYDFAVSFDQKESLYPGAQWITLSDPKLLEDYEDYLVKPTMETLTPEYVFLPIDEIRGFNRDSRALKRGKENYQVFAEFVNNLTKIIRKYDENVKFVIWDDMQNPFHNGGEEDYQVRYGGQPGATWHALDLLDKELIHIFWWYSEEDKMKKMRMSPQLFEEYNLNYVAGNGYNVNNIKIWSYMMNKYNGQGMITHKFHNEEGGIPESANYSWNTLKSKDKLKIEFCDGIDNDGDDIYWETPYKSASWGNNIDEGFNLTSDIFNCGECGNICYYPNAYSSCQDGNCQFEECYKNFENADNNLDNGCEVRIN